MNAKNISCVAFFVFLFYAEAFAQSATDDLDLLNRLQPVDSSNIFQLADQYVWCASVIKGEDGKYHMFYSRWPHGKRETKTDSMNYIFDDFRGWQKYSEIAHAVSKNLTGPYHHVNTILKGDGDTARWDRFTMHNPYIVKFAKKYYLYYISNNFNKDYYAPNLSAEGLHWMKYNACQSIGVLVADKISDFETGKYKRIPEPIMSPDNVNTFEVTNNPAVTKGPDGKYYMMYKSHKKNAGTMTMWMAKAPTPIGPFKMVSAVFTDPDYACEDPTLWYDKKRKRFYAVLKNFTKSGKLTKEFGALVLITSTDGLNWGPATHTLVSNKKITDKNGVVTLLENLERPFIYLDKNGQPAALFAASKKTITASPDNNAQVNTFNVHILLKPEN